MKQIIYFNHTDDCWYMTSKQNYESYIQNPRNIHKLNDIKTIEDVYQMIEKMCNWYNDEPKNYTVIY